MENELGEGNDRETYSLGETNPSGDPSVPSSQQEPQHGSYSTQCQHKVDSNPGAQQVPRWMHLALRNFSLIKQNAFSQFKKVLQKACAELDGNHDSHRHDRA